MQQVGNAHSPTRRRAAPKTALTAALCLALPLFILLVDRGGSVPLFLLAVAGAVAFARARDGRWASLAREQRLLCSALALYIASILLSLSTAGFSPDAVRTLDVLLLRPLFAVAVIFLFARISPPEGALWFGLAGGAFAAGVSAFIEVIFPGGEARASGATNPIIYGNLALAMGFMSVAGTTYFLSLGRWYLVVPLLALAMGLTASLLSGTRGGWIAIPLILPLLFAYTPRGHRLAILVAAGIVSAGVGAALVADAGVGGRVSLATEELTRYFEDPSRYGGTSTGLRFEMWRAALDMFQQRPLLGWGLGDAFHEFLRDGAGDSYHPRVIRFSHAHNEILMTLATRGIIGTMALLAVWLIPGYIFVRTLKQGTPAARRLGLAGLILVVGYLVFGFTEAIMHRGPPLTFFCFYAPLIVCLIAQTKKRNSSSPHGLSPPDRHIDPP